MDHDDQDMRMREIDADGQPLQGAAHPHPLGYEPPSIRALGTVAELTGSGSGQNADATTTGDQPGGSGVL